MKPIDSQSEDLEFTLFVGALKVPKSKRRAWVTEQCAGDHSLRVKVLSLLDQDESGNSLLEQGITADVIEEIQDATVRDLTARCSSCGRRDRLLTINGGLAECDECTDSHSVLDTSREQDDDMALPATIAHFQILETVGEGGFATVYRARDQKLGRVVALKVPHRGKLSRRQSERFLQEARTAAQLSHPRIVTVYEAGRSETGNETLYIASGYIEGGTLAQRLRQGEVSRQQLVETAFEIASALAHAHEIGVIHRDLKPSNILVDEEGHSHLADFGLAKRVSADQAMTLEGELIGTPVYMSPEQVRGDSDQIDASSDIYAFGVVLFEMLTNERPFRGSIQRILQQTLYDEPTDPRKLDPTIPADLATICLKCLEKSPNARYASSCELVEELDRYRRREPIKARPVGYVVRITRWARRKPVVAGLAVALVWASLITTFFAWRASVDARQLGIALGQEKHLVGEKNQLLVEKQSLIERLSAARDSEQIARETAETRTAEREAVFSFFREYILAPATVADQRMALRTDTTILEAMDAAEPRISEQFRDRPLIESAVRRTMASTYLRLGRYQSAIDQLRLTLDIETKYATLSRQAETMTELVRARVVAGQYQPALEICQRAHVLAQQAHGPKSEIALRASAEWGNAQRLAGQLGQAAKRLEQTLQAAEDALGEKHPITIATMRYLASCFGEMTRYDHAIQLHERAVRLGQSSVGEHDQTTLRSMQGLAVALANAGRESDAIRLLQIVAEGQAVAIGSSHPESLVTRGHVATMSRGTVDHEETVAELQYVLDHLREKIGPLHPDTLWVVRRLALVRYEMGEPQQAIELLRPLLPRVTSHFGSGHKLVASMMFDLSQYYWASGQHGSWVQAIGDHYQFQIARDEILPSRKHKVGWHLERYAGILNAQHCYEDAERISKQAVDRLRNDAGSDWLLDQAKFHLGSALLGQRRFIEAEGQLLESFDDMRDHLGTRPDYDAVRLGQVMQVLVTLYDEWGKTVELERWRQALTEYEANEAKANDLRGRSAYYESRGDLHLAVAHYEEAERLPYQRKSHELARLYARCMEWKKAEAAFDGAFPLRPSFQTAAMQFRQGKLNEYLQSRKKLLARFRDVNRNWQFEEVLRVALLRPIESSDVPAIRYLTAVNENRSFQPARHSLIAKAKYRLGEFRSWYGSLEPSQRKHEGLALLVALDGFHDDPSKENRARLSKLVIKLRGETENMMYENIKRHCWLEYIENVAWIEEAQRSLRGGEINSRVDWPDAGIRLRQHAKRIADLRARAYDAYNTGLINRSATLFEELAKIPGAGPEPIALEVLARTQKWKKTLDMAERLDADGHWAIPTCLFRLGELREFNRRRREVLLAATLDSPSEISNLSRVASMAPIDEELHPVVARLAGAHVHAVGQPNRQRVLIGPLMYRLGKFSVWYADASEECKRLPLTVLVAAMAAYEQEPVEDHRDKLIRAIELVEEKDRTRDVTGTSDLGKGWLDVVWRASLLEEARRLAEG